MNFILRIILNGLFAYYFLSILPWWIVLIFPFLIGIIFNKNYLSHFLSGLVGIGVAWLYLLLNLDTQTNSIISSKIIDILSIESVNLLIIYISLSGGVLGGLSEILGKSLRDIFSKTKKQSGYKFN